MKKNLRSLESGSHAVNPHTSIKAIPRAFNKARLRVVDEVGRLDRLYFPFSRFEDCMKGNRKQRMASFKANKERKGIIMPYLGAWAMRALAFGAAMSTCGDLDRAGFSTSYIQAALGIGLVGCVVVCAVLWVSWLSLTFLRD